MALKHGMMSKYPRIYNTWKHMMSRCYTLKNKSYENYGGRGIVVCDEWHDVKRFVEWALSNGYNEELSIERISNNGIYCPENCKWITMAEQAKNKRNTVGVKNAEKIKIMLVGGNKIEDLAKLFNVGKVAISLIKRGKHYSDILPELNEVIKKRHRWSPRPAAILIGFMILFSTNSFSQKDTLCFPVESLRKVMIAAEEAKILKEQKKLLEERISNLQSWVKGLEEKSAEQTAFYESQVKNLLEQKAIYDEQLKSFEKIVRREKRKRFWTAAGGFVTTAAATYLFITK